MGSKIVKNYVYNLIYQIFVMIVPLITAPYLARTLGAQQLGIYSYINSSESLIQTICLLGIYTYGNRQTAYLRDNKDALNQNFWELMLTRLGLAIIATIVYFTYASFGNYSEYFLYYYPYTLATFIDSSWLFVGMEDMRPAVVKNFFAKLAGVICIFAFVKEPDDLWKYIFILAISTFIANFIVLFQARKYIQKPKIKLKNIPQHLRGSIVLFLPQVASLIYLQMDKVMMEWITGDTAQISYYDQAEKIVKIPLTVITVLGTVIMPRLASEFKKNDKIGIENLLTKAGIFSMFLAFPMMFGIASIASDFIPWYLGNEFYPVVYAMILMSPLVVFNSLVTLSGQYFTATDQVNILLKGNVTAAVCNVIINALLIPFYGYMGAAVATLVSSFISALVQYFYLSKQIKIKPILKASLKYLFFSIIMAVVIFISTYQMETSVFTTFIQICIGLFVYFLLAILSHDEMLFMMIQRIKRK